MAGSRAGFGAYLIGAVVGLFGRQAWLVGGSRSLVHSAARSVIERSLAAAGVAVRIVAESAGEPTVGQVASALASLPVEGRESAVIVAVGGGSAIERRPAGTCRG